MRGRGNRLSTNEAANVQKAIRECPSLSDSQISRALGCAPQTVARHRQGIEREQQALAMQGKINGIPVLTFLSSTPDFDATEARNRLLLVFAAFGMRQQRRTLARSIAVMPGGIECDDTRKALSSTDKRIKKLWDAAPQFAKIVFDVDSATQDDNLILARLLHASGVDFMGLASHFLNTTPPKTTLPDTFTGDNDVPILLPQQEAAIDRLIAAFGD